MDSDFMNNLANLMKNGNIPDELKNMMNNMNNNNSNDTSNENNNNNSASNINPDMLNNFMNMFKNSNNSSNSNSSNDSADFDINVLLKMKSIMDKMNSNKNDPRSNLLLSLKPYLKESRKNKVEQYVQLFNMTRVIDVLNQNGGENTK